MWLHTMTDSFAGDGEDSLLHEFKSLKAVLTIQILARNHIFCTKYPERLIPRTRARKEKYLSQVRARRFSSGGS